ncbi:MAG: ADP-ribosylglycohydrolase family protein [Actinomycetes bacterium]
MVDISTQHAIGALVGAAVGDALGAPFEFTHAVGEYTARFPQPVLGGAGELTGGGGWAPGEFTDDTQMALGLAESLIACGGFDADDLWARWVAWKSAANDVGNQTRQVLSRPHHEGAALAVHESNGRMSAGNGSVMRNTPVALWTADATLEDMVALATAQATLTHHDEHNGFGAAIHAGMLRAGLHGRDVFAAIDEVLEVLPPQARERWAPLLAPDYEPEPGTSNGDVFTCLAQAVWAVRQATDFEAALARAIDLGRDTDTVACVAGSIAGARWGIQGIPSRWLTYVHGWMTVPAEVAVSGAHSGKVGPENRRGDPTVVYDHRSLQRVARALLGKGDVPDQANDTAGGPTRVHDEFPLHAADLLGAATAGNDWAVISLCRTPWTFDRRPVRRQVYLVDRSGAQHNADPVRVLTDVVDTIDTLLAEDPDRPVLVHCHGGRSRTAFVLEAWAMRRFGWTAAEAHAWLTERWPRAELLNSTFVEVLERGWPN